MPRSARFRLPFLLALTLAALSAPTRAEEAAELTVERIMAEDWIGTPPEKPYWSEDGRAIYYRQRRPKSDVEELHRIDLASGRDVVVPAAELAGADYPGVYSADRRAKAWIRDDDVWARLPGRRGPLQLTRTSDKESAPLPLSDGRIAFRRGDAFFAIDPESGRLDTLADVRFEKDPEEAEAPDGFLEEQQRRLFDVLRDRAAREEEVRERDRGFRRTDLSRSPRPWYFAEKQTIVAAALAPSGEHLFLAIAPKPEFPSFDEDEDIGGGKPDEMPVWVTDSGYVEPRKVRPKVGTGSPETPRLFLLYLDAGERRELDLSPLPGRADDPLASLRVTAKERLAKSDPAAASPAATTAPPPRALRVDGTAWSDDGARFALQLISYDNKDRWIATVDPADTVVRPLHRESDPAWLGWSFTQFGWMRDGRAVWFLSEESGYSHLYLQPPGGARTALTQGPFEVDDPVLARDGRSFFVSANREHPGIFEAYRVSASGGALERLTTTNGKTAAIPSPDEKQLLLTSSWTTKPTELYVQPARAGAAARKLTSTTSPEFASVAWVAPEIVPIPSTHFAGSIQSRVYDLAGSRPAAGAPAVVFVHGAGYLQNAHSGWSSYYREFMFHTLLARRGYVVLDMDYRASAGYGRDHRTAIYRQMGWPEVEDLQDGVAWLVANRGVDPKRVGVYGGSYGGFLTFMSMFRVPELFAAGAALRPVTDWAHYNHGYTSAILNTPEVDPEAYDRSSPIEFAAGLAKPLLICHGMVDDNVTFQDTVRLVQRLIELGKTDWFETAIYPVEPHAFKTASGWTDEYKRVLKLFETHLK